jgi:exopolysaccharide production protein ExoQ
MSPFDAYNVRAGHDGGYAGFEAPPRSDIGYVSPYRSSSLGSLYSMLERLFVFLLLFSSMNFVTALRPSTQERPELKVFSPNVDVTSVAIDAAVYVYGSILVLMRWRRVLRAARAAWPLLALACLACLSTAWSIHPLVTLRRSLGLLAATMFAIYLGERYSIKEFARLLARAMCLMITLVLLFYLIAPNYVIDYSAYGGAWKGLSAYKNTFGEHMAVAVLVLMLVGFHRISWTRYLFLLGAAALLLLSRSAAAAVSGVLGLAAIPLWRLLGGKHRLLAYFLAPSIFFLGVFCLLAFPEPIFQILGRDATLTGRTNLWGELLPIIAKRPILGYGYAAFWTGLTGELLSVTIGTGRTTVPIADNGYIDLGLGLGAVGVCLFLYLFVGAFRRATEYARWERSFIGLWPATYLCIFAVDNVCESALLTTGTFPFLVFAIISTSLAMSYTRAVTAARTAENQTFTWGWDSHVSSL